MAKKSRNRPNVTNTNTTIVSVSGVGQESFDALLELQQKSVEFQQTMSDILKQSLLTQRATAIEELIVARENAEELKALNEMKDSLSEIAKTLKDMAAAAMVAAGANTSTSNTSSALVANSKEDKSEAVRAENEKTDLLKQIAKNTSPRDQAAKASDQVGGIGGMLAALAAGLGVVVGAMRAQLKAIRYFIELLAPDALIAKIRKGIASFMAGISMSYDLAKSAITEKFSIVVKFFDTIVGSIKGFFTSAVDTVKAIFKIGEESGISKVIKAFMSGISKVMAPFSEAFTLIKDFLSGPIGKVFESIKTVFTGAMETSKGFFTTIMETFGKFGSIFKSVASIAEKLFLPITIIMTVWDTVKGAMEGYEKEGIIGGIKGAIKGFFNSLIFGPIDMIKDAIAWVAGFFGFDNAKQALESFNLEKMFGDFMDMLFSPVKTFRSIMGKVSEFFESLKGFKIPEIGFTVPKWVPGIGGDKVSMGPWYPFGQAEQNAAGGTINSSSVAPSPQTNTSGTVSSQSSQVSAMKESNSSNITTVVAPSVSNNVKQTQVAKIEAPVRSSDSSLDRYFSARAVY